VDEGDPVYGRGSNQIGGRKLESEIETRTHDHDGYGLSSRHPAGRHCETDRGREPGVAMVH